MAAVTYGMQDAYEDIVHDGKDRTAEIKPEVGNGLGKYISGGAHPFEDRGRKNNTRNGQDRTGSKTEGHIGMNGQPHGLVVPCAKAAGNYDTGTHGNAVEKANHHKDQTAGGTDSRQGIFTQKIAYTPGVKGIVKLLKDIAQQYRQGK